MKTQAELREIAECIAEAFADDRRPLYRDAAQLAADYLRLTDPTPLTAEHCREAGMLADDCWFGSKRGDIEVILFSVGDQGVEYIKVSSPTSGLLYAARRNSALPEIHD